MATTISTDSQHVTLEGLIGVCECHGYRIKWDRIENGFLSAVDIRRGIVYLEQNLDSRLRHAVSVLAHELGHIALGHGCAQSTWGNVERTSGQPNCRFPGGLRLG